MRIAEDNISVTSTISGTDDRIARPAPDHRHRRALGRRQGHDRPRAGGRACATGTSTPAPCIARWPGRRFRMASIWPTRAAVAAVAAAMRLVVGDGEVSADGRDIASAIRTPEIDAAAATVARQPRVREVLDRAAARRGRVGRRRDGRTGYRHGRVSRRRREDLSRRGARRARPPPRRRSGACGRPRGRRRAGRRHRARGARSQRSDARRVAADVRTRTRLPSTRPACPSTT